ncbi:MAG: hypothetical protein OEW18_11945 [Candidatus Aminicenantes bacterium]|nr:hypothetical protein [Candidatus Aminicenantes bacterium]
MNKKTSIPSLMAFARRDFMDWKGLPECLLSDLESVFLVDHGWRGAGKLGSEKHAATYVMATAKEYQEQIRIWQKNERVLMIDADLTAEQPSLEAIFPSPGKPDTRMDSYFGVILIRKSEWIYAARGLTIFTEPKSRTLFRIVVYQPTTVDHYRRFLRLDLHPRPIPMWGR